MLNHRVVAMVGGAPKRVVCLTCGSEHNYRPAPAASRTTVTVRTRSGETVTAKPTSSSARTQSRSSRAEQERYESWASRTLGRTVESFSRYSMDRTFQAGELILHPKFGEGYVEQVLEGGKVNVMFRDGPRVLAHRPG
nr:MAG: hypothetical protein DIU78_07960 [Pseudomonadota bacterium]